MRSGRLLIERRSDVAAEDNFLEKPFQNWTTKISDLLGTVFLYVDPATDVERVRSRFVEVTGATFSVRPVTRRHAGAE